MQIELNDTSRAWQQAVRHYVDTTLIPREVEAELNGGELPPEIMRDIQDQALALGLPGMDAPSSTAALGLGMVDQVVAWEALGRVTNALCWCFPEAQSWMYQACAGSEYQLETYITPLLEGRRREAYAITEAESGSHEVVNSSATRTDDGYLINGEKWFVTSGNLADFFFVQAKTAEGSDALFLVDKDSAGIEIVENPCSPTPSHPITPPTGSQMCRCQSATASADPAQAWITAAAGFATNA